MIRLLLFACLSVVGFIRQPMVYGQGARIDSLHRLLHRPLPDTTLVNARLHLARLYWYSLPDSAEYHTRQALELARHIRYKKGEAFAYNSFAAIRLLNDQEPGEFEYFFYEYEKKTAEKELEKELADAKAQRYAIITLALALIIAVLTAALFWYKIQTTKKRNEILQNGHRQISELNAQLARTLEALEQQTARLQALDHTKNKLFAIISHDLQTPINGLHTLLLMLENKEIKPAEMQVLLKHLKNNIKGLSETMENLLEWAKIQMRGDEVLLSEECVNVHEAVVLQMQLFAELLKRKNISLHNHVPADLRVRINREHLRIVLRNLIGNAVKFTNPFGEITVYTSQDPQKGIATIFVEDNGIGIAQEKQAIIFNDLSRLQRRGTNGESGSGLGLAFCKELIEKSGGQIGFESAKGRGSTFYIILPALCQEQPQTEPFPDKAHVS